MGLASEPVARSSLLSDIVAAEGKGNFNLMRSLEVIWTAEASVSVVEGRFKPLNVHL
jgi:hypothetical protein